MVSYPLDMDKALEHKEVNERAIIRAYHKRIGAKGGAAGKGAAKRRSTEHYKRAAAARWGAKPKSG